MNWDFAESEWTQFKGKIKARWDKITDAHLNLNANRRLDLSNRLQ